MQFFFICFLVSNLVSFIFMYRDKQKAIQGEWRIPESYLLSLCVAGGFIGTFLAIKYIKHKTKHWQFHTAVVVSGLFWLLGLPTLYFLHLFQS